MKIKAAPPFVHMLTKGGAALILNLFSLYLKCKT